MKFDQFFFQTEFSDSPLSKDLGFGDDDLPSLSVSKPETLRTSAEIGKTSRQLFNDLTSVQEECKFSLMAAVSSPKLSLSERLALIRDPKIMRSQVQVVLERLPLVDDVTTVSEKLLNQVRVTPEKVLNSLKRKRDPNDGNSDIGECWFAKRSFTSQNMKSDSIENGKKQLIRPSKFSSPEKDLNTSEPLRGGKFTLTDDSTSSLTSPHNPFLPPLKSSYLFGFNDDFECVPAEELIVSEEDEDHNVDDHNVDDDAEDSPLIIDEDSIQNENDAKIVEYASPITQQQSSNNDMLKITNDVTEIESNKQMEIMKPPNLIENQFKKIRFPATERRKNMIECKWKNCQMTFTTHGKLSDHLKVGFYISYHCNNGELHSPLLAEGLMLIREP